MPLETAIPLPQIAESRSQLAVPMVAGRVLQGILFVESEANRRFDWRIEDALVSIGAALGLAIRTLQEAPGPADAAAPAVAVSGTPDAAGRGTSATGLGVSDRGPAAES